MKCLVINADAAYSLETQINNFIKNYHVIDYQVVHQPNSDTWYAFLKVEDGRQ